MVTPRSFHESLPACVFYHMSKPLPESTAASKSLENAVPSLAKGEELLAKSPATVLFPNQLHFEFLVLAGICSLVVCRVVNIRFVILLQLWASCYFTFITSAEISGNSTFASLPDGIQLLIF